MTDENKKNDDIAANEATTQPILKPVTDTQSSVSLRNSDTARLKKMKPKPTGPSTDTVQLKVIKEKKKQLAGILTASQTIKLRPETGSSSSSNIKLKSSDQVSGSVDSLRAQRSSSAESGTIKVSKPSSPAAGGASTLKIKSATATGGAGTLKIKNTASTGGTLKLKNSSSTGGTLKLKSDASGDGGTLKLKSSAAPKQAQTPQAEEATQSTGKAVQFSTGGEEPGIVYTIISVASVAAAILAVYKTFDQFGVFYK